MTEDDAVVEIEKDPYDSGNTHQCIEGPFCWMYGRIIKGMFIPWSGYGLQIVNTIKNWEGDLK